MKRTDRLIAVESFPLEEFLDALDAELLIINENWKLDYIDKRPKQSSISLIFLIEYRHMPPILPKIIYANHDFNIDYDIYKEDIMYCVEIQINLGELRL